MVAIMININKILSTYKASDIDQFIKELTGYTLEEKNLKYADIEQNWKFLGNNSSNGSSVNILKHGEKGLIERLTNAIDAVIEKQKIVNSVTGAREASSIIKKAYPRYYENLQNLAKSEQFKVVPYDAVNQVILAANDATGSTKITFDIIDQGTGISGENFPKTILSLNAGNKLSREKSYLIGAFGQGGSTSLAFTYATIIISKFNGKYYFSIIKEVELTDYKNSCYVYLTLENKIPELEVNVFDDPDHNYLQTFITSESGTLIRMIETDISKDYRTNDIAKEHMLINYIDTNLFNVGLPVKIIENRANFRENESNQNRYAHGTFARLQNSKYVKKDWSGTLKVEVNNQTYNIDYFVILPEDENKWGSMSESKQIFQRLNVTENPIIYTVNGQTITSESFNKFKNATGLNFLQYRLLIVINLDVLGMEKYKFFTSDRARIRETDKTRGFLDKVFEAIRNIEDLKEINRIVSEKAITHDIDNDLTQEIGEKVKSIYNKMLKGGNVVPTPGHRHRVTPDEEEDYLQEIKELEISMANTQFYCDQNINIILKTGAQKHVNESAMIYMLLNDKAYYSFSASFMNGRIQYTVNGKSLKPGVYQIQYQYYKDNKLTLESNKVAIEIINEKTPILENKERNKIFDFHIHHLDEQELICDVIKDEVEKKVDIYLCLGTDQMKTEIFGISASDEKINEIKLKIIQPVCLFALFMDKNYDSIEKAEDKNKMIISFVRSILASELINY